jgi:hypothetical protein
MPVKKGAMKELEEKIVALEDSNEALRIKSINIRKLLIDAEPLNWVKDRNYQAAGDWDDKVKALIDGDSRE